MAVLIAGLGLLIAQVVAAPVAPPPGGTIIMYRSSSLVGAPIACPIRYKGHELVELGRGKFARWQVPVGRYIIGNKTSSIEVHVDPGETQYVRCSFKSGMFLHRADLQIVDQEAFDQHKADYTEKTVADVP